MEKLLLRDGCAVDAIGLGTYKVTEDLTGGRSKQIVLEALDIGYRYIDTAAFYANEVEIGEALAESSVPREDIFLATKVWKGELGYEKTSAAIEASLEKLATPYIDLLLIHWPKEFPEDPMWKEKLQGSWKAMEEYYEKGKVRHLGLSNFLPHHIMALMETAKVMPVLDQLELHVGYMQATAVEYCRKHEILVQAWSPLGRNRLYAQPDLIALSQKYQVSVADLLLRFLLQQGIAVIPKASSREHLLSNLNPAAFTISEEDLYFMLCLPSMGWAGEHPDFDRAEVDNRFLG